MRVSGIVAWASVVMLLVLSAGARGGLPFFTDDPEMPQKGTWELSFFSLYEKTSDGGLLTAPGAYFNYSLLENVQLTATPVWETQFLDGESTETGLGDLDTDVKWEVVKEQKERWWPSFALTPHFTFPTGAKSKGLGTGGYELWLPVEIGKSFGNWYLYGEAGYQWGLSQGVADQVIYGVCLQYRQERWIVGAEINGQHAAGDPGERSLIADVGVIYIFNEHWQLQGLLGRTILKEQFGGPELIGGVFSAVG